MTFQDGLLLYCLLNFSKDEHLFYYKSMRNSKEKYQIYIYSLASITIFVEILKNVACIGW